MGFLRFGLNKRKMVQMGAKTLGWTKKEEDQHCVQQQKNGECRETKKERKCVKWHNFIDWKLQNIYIVILSWLTAAN